MRKAVIWDLDGTLLDSYAVIVESLQLTMKENGITIPYDEIWQHTISFSVSSFIQKMSNEYGVSSELLKHRYSEISGSKYPEIKVMRNGLQILKTLQHNGIDSFVFTHRGKTTIPVLDHLGMTAYFKEILTSQSGFARKPAPDAISYLIDKHELDVNGTYYVGDRSLDMLCAKNAGISGILFLDEKAPGKPTGNETHIIHDLMEIASIV